MSSNKVERSVAELEVTDWLDKKKVSSSVREANKDSVELLIDCICDGELVKDDKNNLDYTLKHPFGDEEKVTKMSFKPRLNDKMLKPYLNGVKTNDAEGRLLAYISALTTVPRAILENMDSVDKKVAMAIVIFFL